MAENIKFQEWPVAQRISAKVHASFRTVPEIVDETLNRLLNNPVSPIEPSRMAEVDRIVAEVEQELDEASKQGNRESAQRVLDRLWNKIAFGGFSAAKPELPEFNRILPTLQRYEYPSVEYDLVRALVHSPFAPAGTPQKKVGKINWFGLELDGKWMSREEIRKGSMPQIWQSGEHQWLAQFPPIPTRAELERRAANDQALAALLRRDTSKG